MIRTVKGRKCNVTVDNWYGTFSFLVPTLTPTERGGVTTPSFLPETCDGKRPLFVRSTTRSVRGRSSFEDSSVE